MPKGSAIVLYHSTAAGNTPAPGSFGQGELALDALASPPHLYTAVPTSRDPSGRIDLLSLTQLGLALPVSVTNGGTGATTGNAALDSLTGVSGNTQGWLNRNATGQWILSANPSTLYLPINNPTYTGLMTGSQYVSTPLGVLNYTMGASPTAPNAVWAWNSGSAGMYLSSGAIVSGGGATWTATATGAFILGTNSSGGCAFYANTGLTVGTTYTPTATFSLATAANGGAAFSVPVGVQLTTGTTAIWTGPSLTGAWGTITSTSASDISIASGVYRTAANWIATATSASIFDQGTGGFAWYSNPSGLTVGNSFTPTTLATLSVSGGFVCTGINTTGISATGSILSYNIGANGNVNCQGVLNCDNWAAVSNGNWYWQFISGNRMRYVANGAEVFSVGPGGTTVYINLMSPQFQGPTWVVAPNNGAATRYFQYASSQLIYAYPAGAQWVMRESDGLCYNNLAPSGGLGAYVNISDMRSKTAVTPEQRGLNIIKQLTPIDFERIPPVPPTDVGDNLPRRPAPKPKREIGFSAQEIQLVLPEAAYVMGIEMPDGSGGMNTPTPSLGVQTDGIVAVLVNAVKELANRIEQLEARV